MNKVKPRNPKHIKMEAYLSAAYLIQNELWEWANKEPLLTEEKHPLHECRRGTAVRFLESLDELLQENRLHRVAFPKK